MLRVYKLDRLSECLVHTEVDAMLSELDVDENTDHRILVLYQHMGISQSFASDNNVGELSSEEEYSFAKQQLALMNRRRMNRERASTGGLS